MDLALLCLPGARPHDRLIARLEAARPAGPPLPLATHVGLLFDGGTVIEAVWPRVRRRTRDPGGPGRARPIPASGAQIAGVRAAAEAAVGAWYDLPGLACAAWYALSGRPWKFYGARHASVFCSELAVRCLRAGGVPCCGDVPPEDCTPSAVEAWCRAYAEEVHDGGGI